MKKLSIIAALAAVTILSGCKISEGTDFQPTALGFQLSVNTISLLELTLQDVETLRHLDEYIAADDNKRDEIQDRYFYSMRIVERQAGEWHLIGSRYEMTVITGGTSLNESGATWSYCYNATHKGDNFSSLTNIADGKYRFHSSKVYSVATYLDLTMTFSPYDRPNGEYDYIDIETNGDQIVDQYINFNLHSGFSFRTLSPIRYIDSKRIRSGRLSMSITIDDITCSPEAEFESDFITVHGGKDNAYSKKYHYYY